MTKSDLTDQRIRSRHERLRIRLSDLGGDALVVPHLPDIGYLSGFTGSNGLLIFTAGNQGKATLLTDSRYTIQAHGETSNVEVRISRKPLFAEAGALLARARSSQKVLYPPGQLTVGQFAQLRKAAGKRTRWKEATGLVAGLRSVKDEQELSVIKEAADVASEVFSDVLPLIRPGLLEDELSAEIEYRMRRRGASGPAFETIVASGARSALPHARPTLKPISKNELVVLDLGAILRDYCSDMTRTVFVGHAPRRVREWYRAVLEAQAAAIRAVRSGIMAGDVDAAARRVLHKHRLARLFTHSTGHGLGMEVHEPPRLGRGEKTRLTAGNVITIEPGVYLEGVGGIRIEDDVVVTATGSETLTSATKEFIEI